MSSTIVSDRRRTSEHVDVPHHVEFVSGAGVFVDDVVRPGALSAVVVRSSQAHAAVIGIDTSAAAQMPGVRAVLTGADLPAVPTIPIRSFDTPGMRLAAQPVIATERVRYVGEPLAVVVADDPYLAEDAAEAVEVDLSPLSPICTAGVDADPLFDGLSGNLLCQWQIGDGDVDDALARAAVVIRDQYSTARRTAAPIELRGLVAEWSPDGRALSVWGPTKFLSFTQRSLAKWFDVDDEAVHCRPVNVGGMFGVRGELYPEDFLIPWAARVVRRPVKWNEDRREHFLAINHAPDARFAFELGLGGDGRLVAFRCNADVDMGAYARGNGGRLPLLAIEELPGPYRWDAFAATSRAYATTKTPAGSVRAPLALEATFVRERAIDAAAAELGLPAAEVRRRSLIPASAMPYSRAMGGEVKPQNFHGGDFPRQFADLLSAARYEDLMREAAQRRADGESVGVGIGLFVAHSGLGASEEVRVGIRDGRCTVWTAANEVGQGLDRLIRLVAADALRISPDRVDVVSGETTAGITTGGTFSSRATMFVGNAVRDGCARLVLLLRRRIADEHGIPLDAVAPQDAGFQVAGETLAWADLPDCAVVGSFRSTTPAHGFGGHVALVATDEATGGLRVERLTVAYDCGRAIDPDAVREQLRGGTIHGLGAALFEELLYDGSGQPIAATFMDYLMPTSDTAPPVTVLVLQDGEAGEDTGIRGTGEAGVIGVAAAVANAVAAGAPAVAATIRRLPLESAAVPR